MNASLHDAVAPLVKGTNAVCFECRSPSMWASVSLGIFLCIKCAGQHRAIGTHLSKVRSLTLDDWDQKQLTFLQLGGNDRAATVFSGIRVPVNQKYNNQIAADYRAKLRQEVSDHLGVQLDPENQPIQLDPELQRFSNATAIGSSDFQPKRPKRQGPCDCCNIF